MKRSRMLAVMLSAVMTLSLAAPAFASTYKVGAGDTLWHIAETQLGDGSKWSEILDANKDSIKDANLIYEGQEITIPDGKTPAAGTYTPGTYTGSGQGFGGTVTAEVTVSATGITSVKLTGANETAGIGGKALPTLEANAAAKGADMDGVAGATVTSTGAKDAVAAALKQAAGTTETATIKDGKYTETVVGHEGSIVVTTMILGGKIASVTINSHNETEGVGTYAIDRIPGAIVKAQSVAVDAIGGATVTSAAIKSAVTKAIKAAGGDVAAFSVAPEKAPVVAQNVTEDVDVVIAGAGTAGLMAAMRLIAAGEKNIILFEKQDIPGGSMATAFGGFNGVGSQIYQNFAEGRLPGDATLKSMMYMSSWDNIGDLLGKAYGKTKDQLPWLQQMYETAGELYDWLANQGVGFYTLGVEPALSSSPYFAPGCYSGGCGYFMEFVVNYIESRGVKIIYSTEVTELMQAADGTVTGVKAVGEDGKNWTVNAKHTMLATGSFGKNKEMLEQYHPEWAEHFFNCPESLTGDGIRMGLEAGGHMIQVGAYMPGFLSTYNTHFELAFIHYMYCGMIVNVNGDEFGNITVNNHGMMAAAKADPANGDTFYYVFDEAAAATIRDYDARNMSYKAVFEQGEAVHYDTVEEAAKALNLPNLAATIEKNNECYLKGEANQWGLKAPKLPYIDTTKGVWLMRVDPNPYLTTAGLDCDLDGHILTAEGKIIPGLWGAGDVIGAYEQRETKYGNGFDAAVTFGAVVGDRIAAALASDFTPGIYTPGTYTGTAQGFGGPVTAEVTVSDAGITSVKLTGEKETPAIGGAALPTLEASATAKGVNMDAVTGATVTSTAAKNAVILALDSAKATSETVAVADGTYTATAVGHSIEGMMTVNVTFKDGKITAIEMGENTETAEILKTVTDRLIPRIIEAQSLSVDAIGGATVSSNGVKAAVADAIEQAGGKSAQWYTEIEKSTETVKMEGYDVIVVGLGGSGMASYISAAENGATVFGMEMAGKIGGTSATVSGPMAINPATKIAAQQPEGGKFVEEEDLIADWIEYCRGDAKEEMVRLFVNESGETMDWLIENYGFTFGDIRKFFHPKNWPVWASYTVNKTDAMTAAVEKATAMNEKNTYMLELTGEELIVEDGKIVGVKAANYDGTTYEIYGKTVILATGGFMGNSEMTEKYMGGTFSTHAMTQNNGAGVKMGLSVGANLYNEDMPGMVHMDNVKNIIKNNDLTKEQKAVLSSMVMDTDQPVIGINGVILNGTSNLAFDNWKGGDTYFVLYSQKQIDSIKANGLAKAYNPMRGQGAKAVANEPVADLDEILTVGAKYENVFKADSVEELAAMIGVDASALKVAADGMEGTIYAIAGAGYYYGTCGGLDIDEQFNVLKRNGTPIENLYAVGQDSMGVLFSYQDAYVTYGGAAQGFVLTSGRLAGANAAAFAAAAK